MATTIGKLAFLVVADSSGVSSGLLSGQAAIQRFGSSASSVMTRVSAMVGVASLAFAAWGVRQAAAAETAATGFRVFLGSAEKARDLLAEMQAFALTSPLNMPDLQQGALTLLQYGANGEQVMTILRQLGDVGMGSADKLQLLSLAMGQIISKGHLAGGELRQLTEAGFNPLKVIADQTGMSIGELFKIMEERGISAEHVLKALNVATSEGGQFFGMLAEQSQTLSGRWATLKESTGLLARNIAEEFVPAMKSALELGIRTIEMLNGMDLTTVRNIVSMTAMTAAFAAGASMAPRIVAGITAIVTALRNLAVGQSIVTALSGPKGLLQLAAGAAAAAVAGIAVNAMFDNMASASTDVATEVAKATDAVQVFDRSMFEAADNGLAAMKEQLGGLKDELTAAERQHEQLVGAIRSNRSGLSGSAQRGTVAEYEARLQLGRENVIEKVLEAQLEMQEVKLDAIREQVRSAEDAIRDTETVKVTEARI
jgi:tape measure domain-containing protein